MAKDLLIPAASSSGLGKKAMDKGQFANPPAFPEVSGFTGPSTISPQSKSVGSVQKSPSAKRGRP